jgi:hypothetical protein
MKQFADFWQSKCVSHALTHWQPWTLRSYNISYLDGMKELKYWNENKVKPRRMCRDFLCSEKLAAASGFQSDASICDDSDSDME